MDLHTAAQRYEEVRRFWAREMAMTLSSHRSHQSQIALLRQLADHGAPLPTDRVSACLASMYANEHSSYTSTAHLLKQLAHAGMVARMKLQKDVGMVALNTV